MRKLNWALALLFLTGLFHAGCGSKSSPSSPAGPSSPAYTYPFLLNIGDYGIAGSGNGEFDGPCGLLVYHTALFVVDQLNDRLQKFDLNGNYLAQIALGGSYPTDTPFGIAVDGNGVIYVSDHAANKITEWDENLNSLGTFTPSIATVGPDGLAVDSSNRIYIADTHGGKCMRCANNGTGCVTVVGTFSYPGAIALDGSGNVYISDSILSNVQKFNSNLASGTTIIASGTTAGLVSSPEALAFDSDGNLLVADIPAAGSRLQKFSSSGAFIASIAAPVSQAFVGLNAIAVDANKDVYVTDYYEAVVHKFAPY